MAHVAKVPGVERGQLAERDRGERRARTSHGQGIDQPLAVERGGQSFFYQADHRGSVRKITDSSGLVVNSYDYDAYGNIEASVEDIANPFTYTGREFDAESGLYYYRARYYDPATGRFLAEDPIGFGAGDLNLYRYVFNDPVNFTDPDGRIAAVIAVPVAACLASPACLAALAVAEAALDTLAVYIAAEIAIESVQMSPADEGAGADRKKKEKSCPDGGELTGSGDDASGDDGNDDEVDVRTTRGGKPEVRIRRKDGSVTDITPDRVKEFEPEPKAKKGLKPKKFDDALPGSKGKKRKPTQGELDLLDKLTK